MAIYNWHDHILTWTCIYNLSIYTNIYHLKYAIIRIIYLNVYINIKLHKYYTYRYKFECTQSWWKFFLLHSIAMKHINTVLETFPRICLPSIVLYILRRSLLDNVCPSLNKKKKKTISIKHSISKSSHVLLHLSTMYICMRVSTR